MPALRYTKHSVHTGNTVGSSLCSHDGVFIRALNEEAVIGFQKHKLMAAHAVTLPSSPETTD